MSKTLSDLIEKTSASNTDILMIENNSSTNKITKENFLKEVNEQFNTIAQQTNNKDVKIIACVIRNVGNGFEFINDDLHNPLNAVSLTTSSNRIFLDYGFTGKKVLSLVAVPDETLAKNGYMVGCSVGVSNAYIYLSKQDNVFGYLTKSGGDTPIFTINESLSNGVISATWKAGNNRLDIVHDKAYCPIINCFSRNPNIMAYQKAVNSKGGYTTTYIAFRDITNPTVDIIPPDDTVVCFSINGMSDYINPNDVTHENSNIWIYGLIEI